MQAPEFWRRRSALSLALAPLGALYAAATAARQRLARPFRAKATVISVGNLVAGGAGKTPVALALGKWFAAHGQAAHFLARGYGGAEPGPHRVDPAKDDSTRVGDEALLLAALAPCWIARSRPEGLAAACATGATLVIMDDGHQDPSVAKDLSLVVIDGAYGFGNGRVIPAGPLRETIAAGLARADAVVLVGEDTARIRETLPPALPVLGARLAPDAGDAANLAGRRIVAFAGIGQPEKFFATLRALGSEIVAALPFADHHRYGDADLARIAAIAEREKATAVTTEKDAARLLPAQRRNVQILRVALVWDDPASLEALLRRVKI